MKTPPKSPANVSSAMSSRPLVAINALSTVTLAALRSTTPSRSDWQLWKSSWLGTWVKMAMVSRCFKPNKTITQQQSKHTKIIQNVKNITQLKTAVILHNSIIFYPILTLKDLSPMISNPSVQTASPCCPASSRCRDVPSTIK